MTTERSLRGQLSRDTVYFELDSVHVKDRFGIWVTTPSGYARTSERRYPVLYMSDGNTNAVIAAAASYLLMGDHLRPMQPFIQVSIGYTDDDPGRRFVRRNRDFTPPREPFSERMTRHVSSKAYANALGEVGLQAFLAHAHNGRADHFLAFIEEELHPEIARRYRIDIGNVGLYGHSQGGLFTLYALTSGCRLFNVFGAASPGIMTNDSQVFSLYRKLRADLNELGMEYSTSHDRQRH